MERQPVSAALSKNPAAGSATANPAASRPNAAPLPAIPGLRKAFRPGRILLYLFLGVLALLQVFPLLWVFLYSIQKTGDLFGPELMTFPAEPQWQNFATAWTDGKILPYSLNSLIVVASSVLVSTFLAFCLAYATTRMQWKARGLVFVLVTLPMVIPIHSTLLPNFVWFSAFGLLNTLLGLILPYIAFTLSFNILLFAGHMRSLPKEMEEAAFLEGAGYPRLLFSIIAPMTSPVIMTVVIMTFLTNWNEFIMAYTYVSQDELRTLPFSFIRFQGQYSANYAVQFACLTLVAVVPLVLYFVFSKRIMAGVTAGSVKG